MERIQEMMINLPRPIKASIMDLMDLVEEKGTIDNKKMLVSLIVEMCTFESIIDDGKVVKEEAKARAKEVIALLTNP